jgi:hypothetical protein
LKNSCFVKTPEVWEIENVYQKGIVAQGFLSQSFSGAFLVSEFFNSHSP